MDGLRELAWGLRDLHDVRPQGNVPRTPTFRGSSKILVRPAFWMTICHLIKSNDMFDLADIDSMDGYELCQKAEEMSFDLEQYSD